MKDVTQHTDLDTDAVLILIFNIFMFKVEYSTAYLLLLSTSEIRNSVPVSRSSRTAAQHVLDYSQFQHTRFKLEQ